MNIIFSRLIIPRHQLMKLNCAAYSFSDLSYILLGLWVAVGGWGWGKIFNYVFEVVLVSAV